MEVGLSNGKRPYAVKWGMGGLSEELLGVRDGELVMGGGPGAAMGKEKRIRLPRTFAQLLLARCHQHGILGSALGLYPQPPAPAPRHIPGI